MNFSMLPREVETNIIAMAAGRHAVHCAVNHLWCMATKSKLATAVIKLQRWYRDRRILVDPQPAISPAPGHWLESPLTRWTMVRYFIAKFDTSMIDILCCGFMCGEDEFMFTEPHVFWSPEVIGRLTRLAGGSKKYARKVAAQAAIERIFFMGPPSPSEVAKAAHDAIVSVDGRMGNVASRFRTLNYATNRGLDFLFYHKDLLKEMVDESKIHAKKLVTDDGRYYTCDFCDKFGNPLGVVFGNTLQYAIEEEWRDF